MTVVLKQAIEADDEKDVREAFEVFENLLIVVCIPPKDGTYVKESSLLSKNLRDILQFFVAISANREIDNTYREMALSFMATAVRL
jgi:hypothetical protein